MKLTDANKIRDYVKEQINPYGKPFEGSVYEFGLKIMNYIDNMQTDYDTESVVDELEKQRDIIFQNTDSEIRTVRANAWNKIDILNKAIEIVKHGGDETEPKTIRDKAIEWNNNSSKKVPYEFIDFVDGKREIAKDDDACEWKRDNTFIGMYKTCSDYVTYHKSFKYCPYCGKKINVVE